MNRLYLIQRGTFLNTKDRKNFKPFKEVIDFDYMGSAEFEWGATTVSLRRIIKAYQQGRLKHMTTDIKNINGVPLQLFYIDHYVEGDTDEMRGFHRVNPIAYDPSKHFDTTEYIDEVKKYIDSRNPKTICDYILKERISLHERCYPFYAESRREDYKREEEYARKHHQKAYHSMPDDFWWDIVNDTFMFFSVQDRVDIILAEMERYPKDIFDK